MIIRKESDRIFDLVTANGSDEMTKDLFYTAIHERFCEKEINPDSQDVHEFDIRIVNLPIRVIFMREQIPTEYDENGLISDYYMGLVMRPLPGQVFPYTGQQSQYLYSCFNDIYLDSDNHGSK
jgi:hypothetical protein